VTAVLHQSAPVAAGTGTVADPARAAGDQHHLSGTIHIVSDDIETVASGICPSANAP
jgi:hypothetical protein